MQTTEYRKLSKKEKKKLNARARKDWNGINPITRSSPLPRAYKRAVEKRKIREKVHLSESY